MRVRLIVLLAVIGVAVPAVALASPAKQLEFEAYLTGKSEIPKAASKGKGTVNLTMTSSKVCWKFTKVGGFDKPVVAHIHKGTATTANGPVVVPLGDRYAAKGCTTSTSAIVRAIVKNPKGYYVNIHSTKYPNGAVRGQLHAGD
jgi:hypothetical protein